MPFGEVPQLLQLMIAQPGERLIFLPSVLFLLNYHEMDGSLGNENI